MDGRCAYLTMDDMSGFVADSDLSFAPMAELGWEVEMVPWRSDVDWNDFDLVYIVRRGITRTTSPPSWTSSRPSNDRPRDSSTA